MIRSVLCFAVVVCLYSDSFAQKIVTEPGINPDLPNVLLIGDSISMGYTVPVKRLLFQKGQKVE